MARVPIERDKRYLHGKISQLPDPNLNRPTPPPFTQYAATTTTTTAKHTLPHLRHYYLSIYEQLLYFAQLHHPHSAENQSPTCTTPGDMSYLSYFTSGNKSELAALPEKNK